MCTKNNIIMKGGDKSLLAIQKPYFFLSMYRGKQMHNVMLSALYMHKLLVFKNTFQQGLGCHLPPS